MSVDSIGAVNGPTTTSVGAVSKVTSGHSTSYLNELKEKQNFGEDNIFAASFGNVGSSNGLEETSGTLASNSTGNLFEESAGQLASGNIQDFKFEESAGQLAQGGLNLVA